MSCSLTPTQLTCTTIKFSKCQVCYGIWVLWPSKFLVLATHGWIRDRINFGIDPSCEYSVSCITYVCHAQRANINSRVLTLYLLNLKNILRLCLHVCDKAESEEIFSGLYCLELSVRSTVENKITPIFYKNTGLNHNLLSEFLAKAGKKATEDEAMHMAK